MPHRPRPRGYEAFDIYLGTQDSARDVLLEKTWTFAQQRHITDFTEYQSINKSVDRNGVEHFREKETGRFVGGV